MSIKPLTDLLILTVLVWASPAVGAAEGPKEDQEPPQIFYLEFDGKKVPIELNKPLGTEALRGSKTFTLRVEPYRVFRHAGLSFQYPREYTFENDHTNPGVSLWTLSGPDCLIIIQRYEETGAPEAVRQALVDGLTEKYKDGKKKQVETTWKLKDITLKGVRLEVELAGILIHQDALYSFRAGARLGLVVDHPGFFGKTTGERVPRGCGPRRCSPRRCGCQPIEECPKKVDQEPNAMTGPLAAFPARRTKGTQGHVDRARRVGIG